MALQTREGMDFTLCIFQEEYNRICSTVMMTPDIETGGNLFGLWTNRGNPVVLVALGPGKHCTRTAVSFYQDIPYLERVGNLLTDNYPLCHIGEWHSHHRMKLFEPSGGDCSTVRRNYPTGSQGFVLVIANIAPYKSRDEVYLSPFKFISSSAHIERGEIEIFEGESPFNHVPRIKKSVLEGSERGSNRGLKGRLTQSRRRELPSATSTCSPGTYEYPNFETDTTEQRHSSHLHHRSYPSQTLVHNKSINKANLTPHPPKTSRSFQDTIIRRLPSSSQNRSSNTAMAAKRVDKDKRELYHHHRTSDEPEMVDVRTGTRNSQWYVSEQGQQHLRKIKQVVDSLVENLSSIGRDRSTEDLNLAFKHHGCDWLLEFPSTFPRSDMVLKKARSGTSYYETVALHSGHLSDIKNELLKAFRKA